MPPLLLELAGATLGQRMTRGDTLEGALAYLNRALDKRGVVAFDQRDATERHQAVARTIAVSLDLLTDAERDHYVALAIFPEDTTIPLTTVRALWGMDDFDTEEVIQRLDDFSLLKYHLPAGTIRLHDVLRAYLATQLAEPAALHARLVAAWGVPYHLPDAYAWRWLAYHLVHAGRKEDLRQRLLDFDWLQAKLTATDVNSLITDYDYLPNDGHWAAGARAHCGSRRTSWPRTRANWPAIYLGGCSSTHRPKSSDCWSTPRSGRVVPGCAP